MTIYCHKCGNPLPDIALFCSRCGTPVAINVRETQRENEVAAQPGGAGAAEPQEAGQQAAGQQPAGPREAGQQPAGPQVVGSQPARQREQQLYYQQSAERNPGTGDAHGVPGRQGYAYNPQRQDGPASYGYTFQRQRAAQEGAHSGQQGHAAPANRSNGQSGKASLSRNAKIALAVAGGVVGALVIVFIIMLAAGIGPFNRDDERLSNQPASIGEVKSQYELQEVKANGSVSTLLMLKMGNNGMIELTSGDITVSGKLVRSSQTNGSSIYKVEDLRGGNSTKLLTKGDSLMLMLPDGAQDGNVVGTWRMTIGKAGTESYQTIWATVNQDGTAMLGSSDNNGFMTNWSANVGESIVQTWVQDGDGLYTFTDKNGGQLKARLTR